MKNQISIEACYDIILKNIYKALKDKDCFYRYQVSDKRKDEEGNQIAVINEFVLEKLDTKMLKEIISALEDLSKIGGKERENAGVIILKDVNDEEIT